MILILNLSLSLSLILSSTALSWPEEPAVDLECLNDYDSEMVCRLDSGRLQSCSKYSLNVTLHTAMSYEFDCSFRLVSPDSCECKFQVPGFVLGETYITKLWRGRTPLFTKEIMTLEMIKPKKPINVSVEVTGNGDFRITWRYNYSLPAKTPFVESLHTNLYYGLKGSTERVLVLLEQGRTYYELVGKKLQPNSDYIVTATVSTDYNENKIISDESDPFEFSTPKSLQSFLVIIIPVLCIILILFIVTIFYCYIRIIKQWWNKIPTPKIAPSFEKPVINWASFPNEFSPVYLDTVKLDLPKEKSWKTPSLIDVSCENSYHSVGKSGNSSHVIYGQAGFEDAEDGVNGKDVQCELLEDYQSTVRSVATLDSSKSDNNQQSGNSSSFSNKCYLGSDSSGSSFLNRSITHPAYPSDRSEDPFSSLSENLEPMIQTDFEYGPCNVCPGSTDLILTQNQPPDTETVVVFGYQSVNDFQNNENKPEAVPDAFISFHNDINMKVKPGNFISPQDFPFLGCESNMIVGCDMDEGYQSCPSFQGQNSWSSDQSTDLEHSISRAVTQEQEHAPFFKSLCGPVLHVSPGIQIDCSYQRV